LSLLAVTEHRDGVVTQGGNVVVYDVMRNQAHFGAADVDGHALVWEVTGAPGPGDWLVRCDRIDFPPGGFAPLHTHPGPGIRVLLRGRIRIDSAGETHEYGPFESWSESGPDPVLAVASETEETSFVRVLLLPAAWAGKRTIRYIDPEDEDRPRSQRATIFLEQPLER
jgi:quercetin dioxygenase-like cupin family protein